MCDNAHLYFAGICCIFKLQKRSQSPVPLDVWVPSKLDREAISGCLQLPSSSNSFYFQLRTVFRRICISVKFHRKLAQKRGVTK